MARKIKDSANVTVDNNIKEDMQLNESINIAKPVPEVSQVLNEIFESRKAGVREEIKEIRRKKYDVKSEEIGKYDKLLTLFRDQEIAKEEDFQREGKKPSGRSDGYVAKEKDSQDIFILKHAYKFPDKCKVNDDSRKTQQNYRDRTDLVNELICSSMYQILLADRAPKEALVTPDEQNKDSLYIRSKFFKDSQTLSKFSDNHIIPGLVDPDNIKLKQIEGFEKVIAACHMLGDGDYHADNLMIQKQHQQDGTIKHVVNKIDHGKSLYTFYKDFGEMVNQIGNWGIFKGIYGPAIESGNMKFSAAAYASSLKQMLSQVTEEQINNLVDKKVDQLNSVGFNFPLEVPVLEGTVGMHNINSFEQLKEVYKNSLTNNIASMKRIARDAEIVAKFDNVTPEFKNGMWFSEMAKYQKDHIVSEIAESKTNNAVFEMGDSGISDMAFYLSESEISNPAVDIEESKVGNPVLYAARNNITIEGKNPLQWARENQYKIEDTKTVKEEKKINRKKYIQDSKGSWKETNEQISITRDTEKVISRTDPTEYLVQSGQPLNQYEKGFIESLNVNNQRIEELGINGRESVKDQESINYDRSKVLLQDNEIQKIINTIHSNNIVVHSNKENIPIPSRSKNTKHRGSLLI